LQFTPSVTSPITEHLILAARERKDVQKISLCFSSLQKVDKTIAVVVVVVDDDDDDDQFTTQLNQSTFHNFIFTHLLKFFFC
jgi:hypothetical protein